MTTAKDTDAAKDGGKEEIDDATLERMAEISRLKLKPGEKETLKADLNSILAYMSQIREVEGRGSELYYVKDFSGQLRKDAPRPSGEDAELRKRFSKSKDGMMLAPKSM